MDKHLLNKVRQLDVPEQLELVEAIWDGISDYAETLPLSPEQSKELDDRLMEHFANPAAGLSWDEVKTKLKRSRS